MVTDYNPYHIMSADLERRVHCALLLALEMAKESYPHLVDELQSTEARYTETLETFIGSQNKPNTHKSYEK